MKEQEIVKSILEWLSWKKIFHWRNNTGMIFSEYKGKKRAFKMGQVGSPDIFVVVPVKLYETNYGQIIGLEVKAEKGKQSESQLEWQKNFEKAGGCYLLVRSLDEVIKQL